MLDKIIIVCLLVGSCQSQEEPCCKMKTVGNVDYYFTSEGEVPSQCKSGCIYHEKNKPDSRYCFAQGNLPVFCRNTGISVSEDIITSTNFPSSYQNNIEASHSISVPIGHSLIIHFIEFDLEHAIECSRDFLKIIDNNGKQLFFGCGNIYNNSIPPASEFPVVIDTNTSVVITFKSDASGTKKGFKLKAYLSGPSYSASGEYIDLDGPNGLAPHSYRAEVRCWTCNFDHYIYLRNTVYTFNQLAPTLIFRGPGSPKPLVVKWEELKHQYLNNNSSFDNLTKSIVQFKGATKLVIVTHGWYGNIDNCEEEWVSTLAESISSNDQPHLTATIAMCWNSSPLPILPFPEERDLSQTLCETSFEGDRKYYYDFAASTAKVGEFLSKIISSVITVTNITHTYGVGHSLGAHVMGNIYSFGKLKLNRISGLDPAGPCFQGGYGDITIINGNELWGLTAESADFVDNLHTDGDHFGTFQSMGHIDFFAGTITNAAEQPSCFTCLDGCCHTIAEHYFSASIIHKDHWLTAYPTNDQEIMENGNYGKPTIASQPEESLLIHTGFWAKAYPKNTPKKRMYTPVFKTSNDNSGWAAICDLADLTEPQDKKYCCDCCKKCK